MGRASLLLSLALLALLGPLPTSIAVDPSLKFSCDACYIFRIHREPTIVLGTLPASSCGLATAAGPPARDLPKHFYIVADSLYTLKDSNIFHVSGSMFRIFMLLHEVKQYDIETTVVLPETWSQNSWIHTLFYPYMKDFGASVIFKAPREKFCLKGLSVVTTEHTPYVAEYTLLVRDIMQRACNVTFLDGRMGPDVLVLNRPGTMARKRYIENVPLLLDELRSLGATAEVSLIPPTPCEQIRLISKEYRVIITPHGTHMANFLALSPRTAVIEMNPSRFYLPLFCRLQSSLKIPWYHFIANNAHREAFIYANCSAPDDLNVLPGCTSTSGYLPRCLDAFTRDHEVRISPRDMKVLRPLVGSLLALQDTESFV